MLTTFRETNWVMNLACAVRFTEGSEPSNQEARLPLTSPIASVSKNCASPFYVSRCHPQISVQPWGHFQNLKSGPVHQGKASTPPLSPPYAAQEENCRWGLLELAAHLSLRRILVSLGLANPLTGNHSKRAVEVYHGLWWAPA